MACKRQKDTSSGPAVRDLLLEKAGVRERCPARMRQHKDPDGCLAAGGSLQPQKRVSQIWKLGF